MAPSRRDEFPLLKESGLQAVRIRGDGNCLFSALSDQIFGHPGQNLEVREKVIQHMRNNADEYKPFINVEVGGGTRRNPKRKNVGATFNAGLPSQKDIDKNYDAYLTRMAKGGTWGDNMEIRAFSKAYDIDVRIHKRDFSFYVRANDDGLTREVAHIAYHTWEHYSSVRNMNGPFIGLPMLKLESTTCQTNKVEAARVNTIFEDPPSTPSTPGSFCSSSSGSSSIERDEDSEYEEIWGPNKRQNRKAYDANTAQKRKEQNELQAIPLLELSPTEGPTTFKAAAEKRIIIRITLKNKALLPNYTKPTAPVEQVVGMKTLYI